MIRPLLLHGSRACAVFSLIFAAANLSAAHAADVFLTPDGAGTKDGSSWTNAKAGAAKGALGAAWDALNAGDALHVGSGTYPSSTIKATKSGTEGKPIRLIGEDRGSGLPLFTSNFDKMNPAKTGGTFMQIPEGVTNLEISGLHLKGFQTGIMMRGKSANFKISKLWVEEAREGIRSEGGATEQNLDAGTHNVTVSDCKFERFTKRAVRMEAGNYKWRIERCVADAGGKDWGTESFPICYQVSVKSEAPKSGGPAPFNAKEHDIEFYDCVAMNCYFEGTFAKAAPGQKAYWNGDGYCSEAGVKNLKFVRCVSMHHTDGGWDLKADSPVLIDCVAIDNKENFRFWAGTPQLTNCIAGFANKRGGSGGAAGIWTRTNISADYCTLIENPSAVAVDGKAGDVKLVFKNSIFAGTGTPNPKVTYENSSVFGTTADDPKIAAKTPEFNKPGKEFDSAAFGPGKGFSSTRWGKQQ